MFIPTSLHIGIWNAWILMSIFIVQMIIVFCAGAHLRERSHIPHAARYTALEKYTGVLGNMVWLFALGYSVFLPLYLGTLWFICGLIIYIPGLLLLSLATYNFMHTPLDQMIQSGAYKYSRHPMYLATFLICLGTGVAAASWLFILLSVIMAFCFRKEALIEERYCLDKYKEQYRDYMNTVPRWFGTVKPNAHK